jgi:deoxyribodipyrimidine photo-lyase
MRRWVSLKNNNVNYGVHWFRRDLRVAGNEALKENFKTNAGRVLGLFFFDSKFLSRSDFSSNRFAFFLKTLKILQQELRSLGGDLLILDERPHAGFVKVAQIIQDSGNKLSLVTWNRDYEPFAINRDQEVKKVLNDLNIDQQTFRDHLLLEPDEVFKASVGDFYKVYTPFARKWFEIFSHEAIQKRIKNQNAGVKYLEDKHNGVANSFKFDASWTDVGVTRDADKLDYFINENQKNVKISIPDAGSVEAFKRLKAFKKSISQYGEQRDLPIVDGTSKMSMFLKNGSITIPQIINLLDLSKQSFADIGGKTKYLKELVWREFYYHILYHEPRVETEAFNKKYNKLKWDNNVEYFEKWKSGSTGFPIVDAGMRQLNQTGWMHNRVRMIVASFLTKDLLVNWQWGERYFMEKLLDGDLALNNGGWQWSASTGVDAQPYFRIFNPKLQSERFDPSGEYIKKYIPELRHLTAKEVHEPPPTKNYPKPIIDHKIQKEKAIKLFTE